MARLRRPGTAHRHLLRQSTRPGGPDLSAPELSRQIAILEKEGMVEVAKLRVRRVAVTHVRLSDSGRERFAAYLGHLHAIVHGEN
ncbi:transcriptional regulator [Streptomyces sp. Ac-502]|uniref:transcriptional regulator n=1 Tax=Streptomyces sp. Ac-502 TaxID=3342801 RepID=UPI0038628C02